MTLLAWCMLAGVVIAASVLVLISIRYVKGPLFGLFGQRRTWTDDEILRQYQPLADLPADRLLDLVTELARELRVPRGRLRPTDSFLMDLAPAELELGDAIENVPRLLERYYRAAGLDWPPPEGFQTIGDFVTFAARAIRRAQLAEPERSAAD